MKHTPNTDENADEFLTALESPHKELTAWEEDFLDSLREQRGEGRHLSDRQFEILERIYAEKTP